MKYIFYVILFFTSTINISYAQDSMSEGNVLSIQEIDSCDDCEKYLSNWGTGVKAVDSLSRIIPFLLNVSPARVQILENDSFNNPLLKIFASNATFKNALLPTLQSTYNFKIYDQNKEVEVWEMVVIDEDVLYNQQSCDAYHDLSHESQSNVWVGQGMELSDLQYFLEIMLQKVVINHAEIEHKDFCFRIPSVETAISLLNQETTIKSSVDSIPSEETKFLAYQQYFLTYYGIGIQKKKRIISFRVIEFSKDDLPRDIPDFKFND